MQLSTASLTLRSGRSLFLVAALSVTSFSVGQAQVEKSSELYAALKEKDSLLFQAGFNTCDISQFEQLTHQDFEFYHDQGGVNDSKESFINSIKNGICETGASAVKRELVENSLEVFPLYNNGALYGAVQTGIHRFHTTTAKFTHLWLLENNEWKLARVLSYDHVNQ